MTWEELRLKLQAMAERAVATWPDFAAAVGPVHVAQDGEPDTGGGGFMFCNGRFSQGFFVDVHDGEISDESEPGGNGSLALGEMVTKPQYRAPPCQACAADRPHVALTCVCDFCGNLAPCLVADNDKGAAICRECCINGQSEIANAAWLKMAGEDGAPPATPRRR